VTKGDNPYTNPAVDQALGISMLVHPTWIVGETYGEVPWIGLGQLTLRNGETNPEVPGWERIGNAFAPIELWSMFFLVLTLAILVPFTIGTVKTYREQRAETRAREKADAERDAERAAARAAVLAGRQKRATREPVVFETVN
jgi:hypothetical protein